jgi:hypothetical protein
MKPTNPKIIGRYSRARAAEVLGVSTSRVSQIAKKLEIGMRWAPDYGFTYSAADIRLMLQRDTKSGPKPTANRKAGK